MNAKSVLAVGVLTFITLMVIFSVGSAMQTGRQVKKNGLREFCENKDRVMDSWYSDACTALFLKDIRDELRKINNNN